MPTETIGIGLGDKVSRYGIVDRDGEVVEEGSFRNQTSSIEKHFSGERRRIALEAGAQSAWISRRYTHGPDLRAYLGPRRPIPA